MLLGKFVRVQCEITGMFMYSGIVIGSRPRNSSKREGAINYWVKPLKGGAMSLIADYCLEASKLLLIK